MEAQRFEQARAGLAALLDEPRQTLTGLSDDIRADGLPQNWVDDLPNLTAEQRAALAAEIDDQAPEWALALRALLEA